MNIETLSKLKTKRGEGIGFKFIRWLETRFKLHANVTLMFPVLRCLRISVQIVFLALFQSNIRDNFSRKKVC